MCISILNLYHSNPSLNSQNFLQLTLNIKQKCKKNFALTIELAILVAHPSFHLVVKVLVQMAVDVMVYDDDGDDDVAVDKLMLNYIVLIVDFFGLMQIEFVGHLVVVVVVVILVL